MPTFTIRNVPAEDFAELEARAKANDRSLEAELRELVRTSPSLVDLEERRGRIEAIAERTRGRIRGNSTELIRAAREQR